MCNIQTNNWRICTWSFVYLIPFLRDSVNRNLRTDRQTLYIMSKKKIRQYQKWIQWRDKFIAFCKYKADKQHPFEHSYPNLFKSNGPKISRDNPVAITLRLAENGGWDLLGDRHRKKNEHEVHPVILCGRGYTDREINGAPCRISNLRTHKYDTARVHVECVGESGRKNGKGGTYGM